MIYTASTTSKETQAAAILEESTEALVFDHRCALEDDGLDPDEIDRRRVGVPSSARFPPVLADGGPGLSSRRVRAKKRVWKKDNVRRVEALWRRKA